MKKCSYVDLPPSFHRLQFTVADCGTNYVLYCDIRLFQSYAPSVKKQYENIYIFLRRKYEKKFMFVDKIKIIKRELLLPPHYKFHCHFWKSVKRKEKMSNFRSSLGCGITQKWENIYNSNKKEQWKFLVIFLKGALKLQSVTLLPKF